MESREFVEQTRGHHNSLISKIKSEQNRFSTLMRKSDLENKQAFYTNNKLDKDDPAYKKLEELEEFSENTSFETSGWKLKDYTMGFINFISENVKNRGLSERVYQFITDTPVEELLRTIIKYCPDMCTPTDKYAYSTLHKDLEKAA